MGWGAWPNRKAAMRGVWTRGWADATRLKDTYAWEIVGAALGSVLGVVLASRVGTDTSNWWRALWAVVGVVAGFAGGFVLCLVWQIVNAAWRQRDELRERVRELEAELADRDRVEFSLEAKTEELHPGLGEEVEVSGGTITYRQNVLFWVKVLNHGPPATFTAQLRGIVGVGDSDYTEIDEVAWEHTIEPTKELARGGRARLVVANYAREPRTFEGATTAPCLWFWASRSAMWAAEGHQVGRRFVGLADHAVSFDIEVVDSTHDKTRVGRCQIQIGSDPDAVPIFTLDDRPI